MIGEVNPESLHTCAEFAARLLQASHVLESNARTVRIIASEVAARGVLKSGNSGVTEATFVHVISDIAQELDFLQSQVRLIHAQLEISVATVSIL
jgi:hypothetical protein